MGGIQSSENKPTVPAPPHQINPNTAKVTAGVPISIPKQAISGYSSSHRDALEVIMSPPGSPTNSGRSPSVSTTPSTELVPTVFTWSGGGKSVFVTGSFNDWKEKLPLNMSEKDFTLIRNLPPGTYQYKFVVDGKWVHAQDQPISTDIKGNTNNFVDVKPLNKGECLSTLSMKGSGVSTSGSPPGVYNNYIPDDINNVFSPISSSGSVSPTQRSNNSSRASIVPGLPPHLQRALLNTTPPSDDPSLLPLPHHVMLNHLYILPKAEDITILGVTHRYRTKFVTTVLYKPDVRFNSNDEFTVEIEL
jgi:5'-AMP-activated protein kinase regulatory beta subunit